MKPVRISSSGSRVHVGELDAVLGTNATFYGDPNRPALVYCHGATGSATKTLLDASERTLLYGLAQHFNVIVADLGFDTFGNDTLLDRIAAAKSVAQSAPFSSRSGGVMLVGGSMGAGNCLAFARANPTSVLGIAALIPLLDLTDIHSNNRLGLRTAIDAAYGGSYSDATHGPTRSPIQFAAMLPSQQTMPIHLWTSSNDPYCLPSIAQNFVTARAGTLMTDLGAVGHGTSSFSNQTVQQQIIQYCRQTVGI